MVFLAKNSKTPMNYVLFNFALFPMFFLIIQLLLIAESYGFFITLCNQK